MMQLDEHCSEITVIALPTKYKSLLPPPLKIPCATYEKTVLIQSMESRPFGSFPYPDWS
jgi:hypothetical protein